MYENDQLVALSGILTIDRSATWQTLINFDVRDEKNRLSVSFYSLKAGHFDFQINKFRKNILFKNIGKIQVNSSIYFPGWLSLVVKNIRFLGLNEIKMIAKNNLKNFEILTMHKNMVDLGFKMAPGDQKDFDQIVKRFDPDIEDLKQLLNTDGGLEFWTAIGFGWLGTLRIEKDILSDENLKSFLLKNLKFRNGL